MTVNWRGVYPAATTAFNDDQSIDFEATAKHYDALIRAGCHGLVVLGSVGENTTLEYAEKREVLKLAKDVTAGRVPLLTGVAEYTTSVACRYAADSEKIGLDGLM